MYIIILPSPVMSDEPEYVEAEWWQDRAHCVYVDIRHWPMQIYYMNVINISTINNYLQSG